MRENGLHLERAIPGAMRSAGRDALAEGKTAGVLPESGKNARGSGGAGIGSRGQTGTERCMNCRYWSRLWGMALCARHPEKAGDKVVVCADFKRREEAQ